MSSNEKYNNNGNLSFLLHDVSHRVSRVFDKQMDPLGLTRSQWGVLVYVARQPGIVQTQLAEKLEIGRMAVTGLIDRMELKGLVERKEDTDDRRIKRIFLSPSAKQIIPSIEAAGELVGSRIFSGLSMEDRNRLIGCLLSVRDQVEEFDKELGEED
jgi:MarR family transcriptional regulator for hemolysin